MVLIALEAKTSVNPPDSTLCGSFNVGANVTRQIHEFHKSEFILNTSNFSDSPAVYTGFPRSKNLLLPLIPYAALSLGPIST